MEGNKLNPVCPACGRHVYREILEPLDWEFHTEKHYKYYKCSFCGSLYRAESVVDTDSIYDGNSYPTLTYRMPEAQIQLGIKSRLMRSCARIRDGYIYFGRYKVLGKILNYFRPVMEPELHIYNKEFSEGASFLDIGAGAGKLAYSLKKSGIDAHAIEPYINEDIHYNNGLTVEKKFVDEVDRKYDIAFMDNVLEHLEEPKKTLSIIHSFLNDEGKLGIIIPAYGRMTELYKENSYILQAPQHVCLYSLKGIKNLIRETGFEIESFYRKPRMDWYIKSFMLRNAIVFREYDTLNTLKKALSKQQLKVVANQFKEAKRHDDGDNYYIFLKKI